MQYLIFGFLYLVLYVGLGASLAGYPAARALVSNGLVFAIPLGVCLVVARRRREWEGTQRLFWDCFALGMAMWCVGEIGFTVSEVLDQRSWVQWHAMFSLCGASGPMVALIARPYLGTRKGSTPAVAVNLVSYAMLLGFVYAYFIMIPSVVPTPGAHPQETLLVLVQGHRLVLFAGFAAALWAGWDSRWREPLGWIAAGTAFGFLMRFVTSSAITGDRYYEGSVYDLAWIVPFLCYLAAAQRAPASVGDVESVYESRGWPSTVFSAAPAFLIPLVGFGLLRIEPIGPGGDSVRLLLTTLATVAGLGVLTLRLSVQSSELQRADARLRLLAAATEQTGDLILITRGDGAFEHANDACVAALGYSREALAGMTLAQLLEGGFERMVDDIGTEVRQRGIWRGTLVHRRSDGTTFPASSTVVALRNREGRLTHFVGVQRDITEELRLRDQLVHSERLSAVGELIAGIAHEINNPLQTIIGCAELLIEEQRATGALGDLETVRREATRAGQIVRNLLAFVRRSAPNREPADLNQIATSTTRLRDHYLAQRNITLDVDLHPGILPVHVNREEIQQVVLNLLLNAEHAIGDTRGRITLRTSVSDHAYTLEVSDDGPGVSAQLRGRVFEPFFTTKDVGQGTGLGLSIALGIATAHGGQMELCSARLAPTDGSRPGACFKLTLPAMASEPDRPGVEALSPGAATAPLARAPVGGTGAGLGVEGTDARLRPDRAEVGRGGRRALIIEDEAPIRQLLWRLLARRDYEVIEADCCKAALAALERAGSIDLVLCDVRLGDGNGGDCLRALREVQPDLARRFVFVTGDIAALADAAGEFTGVPVLTKPFTAADFDRVLGRAEVGA